MYNRVVKPLHRAEAAQHSNIAYPEAASAVLQVWQMAENIYADIDDHMMGTGP